MITSCFFKVRIVDEENNIVDIGTDGEVQFKSITLFKEYKGEEQKTREAFTADGFYKTRCIWPQIINVSLLINLVKI